MLLFMYRTRFVFWARLQATVRFSQNSKRKTRASRWW